MSSKYWANMKKKNTYKIEISVCYSPPIISSHRLIQISNELSETVGITKKGREVLTTFSLQSNKKLLRASVRCLK